MTEQRKYASPPVVEALCEVSFADAHWDETVPGRFFDLAKDLGFPLKEPVHRQHAEFVFHKESGPSAAVHQELRMRFRSEDRSKVVQIEHDMIVVNQLQPYPTFEAWSPTVLEVAKEYANLIEAKGVNRVGLRYINQINLPGDRVDLDTWFTVTPKLPPSWLDTAGSFLVRAEKKVGENLVLILTFGSAPPPDPAHSSFMLDFYAVHSLSLPIPVEAIRPLLDEAHSCIERAFEGSITQDLRSRFAMSTS